ncbi:ATP-dependent 6-phosphofructokinase [Peptoniphilus raoultii]|uniref:ATP-dependent 6-phosphofructokinase n=1 Tax=Peptoniphilus raoultii TaxID=1776387 RepID=UPI0008DAC3D5|nr:ATP-dependent 6-phosphofructokinase [Peptoniphilus raoultii]
MKIGILTSGGDAPGMNPAIRAFVRSGIYNGFEVYGIESGFEGLINGRLNKLNESSVGDVIQRGGTFLGTSRSEEFMTKEGFGKALNILDIFEIDALVVCGGDGSLRGALKLKKSGINVLAIPISIDNDLGYTDYTIGFMSCLETVTEIVSKIRDTTESHSRANVVEVMGRGCGDIALYAGLAAGAENIIIPEYKTPYEEIYKKAIMCKNRGKKHHIILMAEAMGDPYEFAREFEKHTGIDTKVTIPGYIQRGGSPSVFDRVLASQMVFKAMEEIKKKNFGLAIGISRDQIISMEIEEALKVKKKFNKELLDILKVISI